MANRSFEAQGFKRLLLCITKTSFIPLNPEKSRCHYVTRMKLKIIFLLRTTINNVSTYHAIDDIHRDSNNEPDLIAASMGRLSTTSRILEGARDAVLQAVIIKWENAT